MFYFWETGVYKRWAWIATAAVIMMSVLNQSGEDQVECPLCMEPFEVDDLNFFPCTCGYQVSIHLCRYDCFRTHVIMQLWVLYFEVLIHFSIWLSVHSPNKGIVSYKSTMKVYYVLLQTENEKQITSLGMLAAVWFKIFCLHFFCLKI